MTHEISIASLLPGESLRSGGCDAAHVQLLAAIEAPLPPIRVHRQTMRVIDGMHRLQAALVRGRSTIEVVYFDGSGIEAFLLAVEANITHGLPLTLADRRAAAARIIETCPGMSDRAIAGTAGLSPKTVGVIRSSTTAADVATRVGLDGRCRPVDSVEGRRAVREILVEMPNASLREVAGLAGVSPNTVRRVRKGMQGHEDSADRLPGEAVPARSSRRKPPSITGHKALPAVLEDLQKDPSLRLTESGRSLLRWLVVHKIEETDWRQFVGSVPPHCVEIICEVAHRYAEGWRQVAAELAASTRVSA